MNTKTFPKDLDAIRADMNGRYANGGTAYDAQSFTEGRAFDRIRHMTLLAKVQEMVEASLLSRDHGTVHSMLDIGCGVDPLADSPFGRKLLRTQEVKRIVGVDISAEAVARCAAKHADNPSFAFFASSVEEMDVDKVRDEHGPFHLIVGVETIEHWADVDKGLANLSSLLEPGGTMVLTTPNRNSLHVLVSRKLGREPPVVSPDHTHEFGWDELDDKVLKHGFTLVDFAGAGFAPYWTIEGDPALRHLTDHDIEINTIMTELADACPKYAFCQIKSYTKVIP